MKATSACSILGTLAIGLAGCATAPRLPPEAAAINIVGAASPSVGVLQPSLRVIGGELVLVGCVYKKVGAETTERTHLDVAFLGASGALLETTQVAFEPRKLRRAPRPPAGRGHYMLPLPALPAGTTRIEVRAHDRDHETALGVLGR